MNLMKSMKDLRTTTYFRDFAIAEVQVAYRIKEYLEPDEYFPPKNLDKTTKILFENKEYREAIERIIDRDLQIDISSSSGYESLVNEGMAFVESLVEKSKEDFSLEEERER